MACSKNIVVEVAVMVAVIAVIWGLMSLPVIFYFLPQQSDSDNTTRTGFDPSLSCTPTDYIYKGEVCKDTLLALKQCIINQPPDNREDVRINISTTTDLLTSEQLSTIGVQYIQTLDPGQECVAVLVPFLCQYLFTPCDERGVAYYPSSEDCVYIRDQVCASEWEEITTMPTVADYLPNCESLPDDTLCNIDLTIANGLTDSTNVSSPLMCSEGFVYIEEVHQCHPHCPSWGQHEHGLRITYNVIFGTTAVVSVLASIVVLLLSCVRYKRMFTFPSVIIVYQVVPILILGIIFLIGFTDREALFCNSQDWFEVLNSRGTSFCAINAVVLYYTMWQTALWWFFHISAMFIEIKFPLRTHSFKASGRMKYVHIGLVTAGILIPVIPVTVIASVAGFVPAPFPPIFCYSASGNAIFYGIVFPMCVLFVTGISLLVCIVWLIIKGYCRYNRSKKTKEDAKTVTAKLLILFSYFTLCSVVILTVFAVNIRITPAFLEALFLYFHCERDPANMECDRTSFQQHTIVSLTLVAYILISAYPLSCLVYAVNTTELRGKISMAYRKFRVEWPTTKQVNNQLQPSGLELHTTPDSAATLQTFASANFIDS